MSFYGLLWQDSRLNLFPSQPPPLQRSPLLSSDPQSPLSILLSTVQMSNSCLHSASPGDICMFEIRYSEAFSGQRRQLYSTGG